MQMQLRKSLRNEKPNPLPNIPRPPLRPLRIRRIQRRLPRHNIRLLTPNPPRPLENPPKQIQPRINRNPHIRRHKPARIKPLGITGESVEAVKKSDDTKIDEGEPGGVGLEGGFKDEAVAGDVLGAEGGVEADVGDADADPGEELGYGDDVLEPGEYFGGAFAAGHVG